MFEQPLPDPSGFNNVMLDLETLGITPGSIVLSIGAVEFNETNLGQTFHMGIFVESSVEAGMQCDASTAMWWISQSEEAQKAILNMTADAATLTSVLHRFSDAFPDWKSKRIWANGAAFDFPILAAAYKKVGMVIPWRYSNEMDMRTIKGCVGKKVWDRLKEPPTVAHDGLADAISQARTLQKVLREVGAETWLA